MNIFLRTSNYFFGVVSQQQVSLVKVYGQRLLSRRLCSHWLCESICLTALSLWMIKCKSCQVFWGSVASVTPRATVRLNLSLGRLSCLCLGRGRRRKMSQAWSLRPGAQSLLALVTYCFEVSDYLPQPCQWEPGSWSWTPESPLVPSKSRGCVSHSVQCTLVKHHTLATRVTFPKHNVLAHRIVTNSPLPASCEERAP